jgi:hypothetical protein
MEYSVAVAPGDCDISPVQRVSQPSASSLHQRLARRLLQGAMSNERHPHPRSNRHHDRGWLVVGYALVHWARRMRTLQAADRILRSFSTQQSLVQAPPVLRNKLERYRLAKVRRDLGASSEMHAVASELVAEYRLFSLDLR